MDQNDELRALLERWYSLREGESLGSDFFKGVKPELVERFMRIVGRTYEIEDAAFGQGAVGKVEFPVEKLGIYRLVQELGGGGMSRVFVAEDMKLHRLVALKIIAPFQDAVQKTRFRREAEVTAALDHPSIVPVFGFGEESGFVYMAMRLLSGPSLAGRTECFEPDEAARMILPITDALQAAHEVGVIHRDIKPSNIVLSEDKPFLVDFGLARQFGREELTEENAVPGTLLYMSPEQLQGDRTLDPRTDIYALGVVMYEMVAGHAPLGSGKTRDAAIRQILLQEAKLLPVSRRHRDFQTIVHRCLEKDRSRRFATAKELGQDLTRFLEGRPIASRRTGPISRTWKIVKRHPRVSSATALVFLALSAQWGYRRYEARVETQRIDAVVGRITSDAVNGRLDAAMTAAKGLAEIHPDQERVRTLASKLEAEVIVRDVLDDAEGHRHHREYSESRLKVEALLNGSVTSLGGDRLRLLSLALASFRCGDSATSRRLLDRYQSEHGRSRAESAIQCLLDGEDVEPEKLPPIPHNHPPSFAAEERFLVLRAMRCANATAAKIQEELKLLLDADPGHFRGRLEQAVFLRRIGKLEMAEGVLLGLLALDPDRRAVRNQLASIALKRSEMDDAARWLNLDSKAPVDAFQASLQADLLRLRGEASYSTFLDAQLLRWPKDSELLRLRALSFFEDGLISEAQETMKLAHENAVTEKDRSILRVHLLGMQVASVISNPKVPPSSEDLQMLLERLNSELDGPRPPEEKTEIHLQRGWVLERLTDPEGAALAYELAISEDSSNAPALLRLGSIVTSQLRDEFHGSGWPISDRLRRRARQLTKVLHQYLKNEIEGDSLPTSVDRDRAIIFLGYCLAAETDRAPLKAYLDEHESHLAAVAPEELIKLKVIQALQPEGPPTRSN